MDDSQTNNIEANPPAAAVLPADNNTATINSLKETLRVVVDKLNEVCKVNSLMLEKIKTLTEDQNELYDRTYEQTIDLASLNQYGRRENVEFCNIPESVDQNSLQKHIITVMGTMNINISGNNNNNNCLFS